MADRGALMFVADPGARRVWMRSGIGLKRSGVLAVGAIYETLLAAGGPHGIIAELAGRSREQLLAEQAELRQCWRAMGWK